MSGAARTRIKICGIIAPDAAAAGTDALGFVFAEGSPRQIDVATAERIAAAAPPLVTMVGVHRTDDVAEISAAARAFGDRLQLHGDVDETQIAAFGRPIIRAFGFDPAAMARWDGAANVSALLVDGPSSGSGTAFDHAALAEIRATVRRPLILAGGLTPENVGAAIRVVRPDAVDVSSGVEDAPGRKCPDRIAAFCAAVREADGR